MHRFGVFSHALSNRREGAKAVRLMVAVLVAVSTAIGTVPPARSQGMAPNPAKVLELKMALRALYGDHIFWVRDLVIATRLGVTGEASEADEYGLKNAKAIGQSIAPVYGDAAAAKFATLFVGHYEGVKNLMKAIFANGYRGDAARKKAALEALQANGKAIAAFVSGANPNLPEGTVYGLLVSHVQHHVMQMDATAKKDWGAEADEWEPMIKQVYGLSDALADGIAKQFPNKFQ